MCSIHIDEFPTRVDCCTVVTSSVYLSLKSWSLLDRLDNQHTMNGSRTDTVEWVRMDRKDPRYYRGTTLHGL
jgi:hypothetical protein